MLDPTGKNTTDVFKLTCHCIILAVYLVESPDDRLVNESEACSLYLRKNIHVVCDWKLNLKWIKPTDALNSNFIGMTTVHVSGSLSAHHQEFWAVHRLRYIICSCGDRLLPGVACHPTPGSISSPQLHIMYQSRCTAKNSWWWAERLPETRRVVILKKLEFSASVGFIHFNLLWCTVMRT